jgi:hypothetical protein
MPDSWTWYRVSSQDDDTATVLVSALAESCSMACSVLMPCSDSLTRSPRSRLIATVTRPDSPQLPMSVGMFVAVSPGSALARSIHARTDRGLPPHPFC